MKKLRMIVTSVIILAIVSSAFAFKAKLFSYCVRDNANPGTKCTNVVLNSKIVLSGGTQYKWNPSWDGDRTACTNDTNGLCIFGPIRLAAD